MSAKTVLLMIKTLTLKFHLKGSEKEAKIVLQTPLLVVLMKRKNHINQALPVVDSPAQR
jgi:hypothetical protein